MHMFPEYLHIKYLVIPTNNFQIAAIPRFFIDFFLLLMVKGTSNCEVNTLVHLLLIYMHLKLTKILQTFNTCTHFIIVACMHI